MKLIEELKAGAEGTLNTIFLVGDLDGEEDDSPYDFNLIDSLQGLELDTNAQDTQPGKL